MKEPHSPSKLLTETTETANNFGCLRVILIGFTIFVITMMFVFCIAELTSPYLQTTGVQVNATVVEKATWDSCSDGGCRAVYCVRYTFTTLTEQQVHGEEFVDRDQYHQILIGADWPIVYLRPVPTTYESRYHAVVRVATTRQFLCFSLVTYLFLFILIGLNWFKERQFQRKSILTQGMVTQRWKKYDEEYNYHYFITYTFPDSAETQATLTLSQYQQLKVGSPLMVRYLPSNPRRSRLEW